MLGNRMISHTMLDRRNSSYNAGQKYLFKITPLRVVFLSINFVRSLGMIQNINVILWCIHATNFNLCNNSFLFVNFGWPSKKPLILSLENGLKGSIKEPLVGKAIDTVDGGCGRWPPLREAGLVLDAPPQICKMNTVVSPDTASWWRSCWGTRSTPAYVDTRGTGSGVASPAPRTINTPWSRSRQFSKTGQEKGRCFWAATCRALRNIRQVHLPGIYRVLGWLSSLSAQ